MTDAKLVAPDEAHHAIERYREGRIFTPPRQEIIDGALTIAAKYAKDYGVALLGWAIMGNHTHILPVDRCDKTPSGVSEFMTQFKSKLTMYLQVVWNIDDPIFTDMVMSEMFPTLDVDRIFETIAYVETNPLKDGLVRQIRDLTPGAVSTRRMRLEPLTVKRPKRWFRKETWPDEVELKPEVPTWLLEKYGLSQGQFNWRAASDVFRETHRIVREKRNEKVIGLTRLKAETPYEPGKVIEKTDKVMCAGSRQSCARYYMRLRKFKRDYKKAQMRVREGKHRTKFPYGTNRMANSYGFEMIVPPG